MTYVCIPQATALSPWFVYLLVKRRVGAGDNGIAAAAQASRCICIRRYGDMLTAAYADIFNGNLFPSATRRLASVPITISSYVWRRLWLA